MNADNLLAIGATGLSAFSAVASTFVLYMFQDLKGDIRELRKAVGMGHSKEKRGVYAGED